MAIEHLSRCISSLSEARELPMAELSPRLEPTGILMCDPNHFEVKDVKNAFMEGNLNAVEPEKASQQWNSLRQTFEELGYQVQVIESQPGLEDMVFTANQVLVGHRDSGQRYIVLGRMTHPSRRQEVPHFAKWFRARNYQVLELECSDQNQFFEGHGDAVWHPGKQFLWGGYGHRTHVQAYTALSQLLDVPVVTLRLVHPQFYHLDTAFCPIDSKTVIIYPPAFEQKGLDLIKYYFPQVISVSHQDAQNFGCNAVALQKIVVLQRGSIDLCKALKQLGFNPIEVDTSEFMKSGGSVFCLKTMIFD